MKAPTRILYRRLLQRLLSCWNIALVRTQPSVKAHATSGEPCPTSCVPLPSLWSHLFRLPSGREPWLEDTMLYTCWLWLLHSFGCLSVWAEWGGEGGILTRSLNGEGILMPALLEIAHIIWRLKTSDGDNRSFLLTFTVFSYVIQTWKDVIQ
jgi:hypothetical protein